MIRLLQIKNTVEVPVYIAPEHIVAIDGARIETVGETYYVTDSPSEVARLITEYKQRQMRLQAAYAVLYADYKHTIVDKVVALESEDRG